MQRLDMNRRRRAFQLRLAPCLKGYPLRSGVFDLTTRICDADAQRSSARPSAGKPCSCAGLLGDNIGSRAINRMLTMGGPACQVMKRKIRSYRWAKSALHTLSVSHDLRAKKRPFQECATRAQAP